MRCFVVFYFHLLTCTAHGARQYGHGWIVARQAERVQRACHFDPVAPTTQGPYISMLTSMH